MKNDRIEAELQPVVYSTLEEALASKLNQTKQVLAKLNPSARKRLAERANAPSDIQEK